MTGEPNGMWEVSQLRKYPNNAKLCDYIVVSEFDIDTGSTVRHQYPDKIQGVTEDWLAENMLPEGVHNRDADSTFIFLNRDKQRLDDDWLINPLINHSAERKNAEQKAESSFPSAESSFPTAESSFPSAESSFPTAESSFPSVFRYGFNLVHTKHDSSVRRGAIVKAMAIFSSYPFVDCLESPLYTALEKYFIYPDITVLKDLYVTLNSYDMKNIPCPSVSEKGLMRRGIAVHPNGVSALGFIPSSWNHKILLYSPTSNNKNNSSNKNDEIEGSDSTEVTETVSQIPHTFISASIPTSIPVSISLPLHRDLDCMGHISITSLIRLFGDSSMRIYNAILSRQKVIFVGYNHAARDVCKMVLSAAAMVAPLPTVLRRTYPYANLTDLSFLETVGYIAGVTNPMFLERDQWWDLACVLDLPNGTGVVYSPEERRRADEHPKGGINNNPYNSGYNSGTGNSGRGGIYGGLANVGGRLLPFENPETTQQHIQDTADNKHITGILSVITTKMFHHPISEEEWVAQRFYEFTSSIIEGIKDLGPDTGSGRRNENDYHNEKNEKYSDKNNEKNDKSSERNEKYNEKYNDRPDKPEKSERQERHEKSRKKDSEYATVRVAALRSSPELLLIPVSPWTWVAPVAPIVPILPVVSVTPPSASPAVISTEVSSPVVSGAVSGAVSGIFSDDVTTDDLTADGVSEDCVGGDESDASVPAITSISPHIDISVALTVTESVLGSASLLSPTSLSSAGATAAGVIITKSATGGVTGIIRDEPHPLNPPNPPHPPFQRNLSRLDHNSNNSIAGVNESTLRIHIRRLLHRTTASNGNLSNLEVVSIFSDILRSLYSESSVQALLTLLPLALGGIDPIGMGLLHPNPSVRLNSLGIIQKVLQYQSTKIAAQSMNDMLLVAYKRQLKLYETGELGKVIVKYEINLKAEEKAVFSPLKHPAPYTHPPHPPLPGQPTHSTQSGISGSNSRPIAALLSPGPQSNHSNLSNHSNQTGAYEILSPSSPNDYDALSPVSPVSLTHSVSPLSPGGEHRTSTAPTAPKPTKPTTHPAPTSSTTATANAMPANTSHMLGPTVAPTVPVSTNNEMDIIPAALLSFAAAASGFMTGMTGILTATDPADSYNEINTQREPDQGAMFPPIELIPY